ncbi:MAG: iron ABC transporter permease [Clostridia bacterium]|nr:iron ABC transporter permease [Clostridia bacterium]
MAKRRIKYKYKLLIAALIFVAAAVASICFGTVNFSPPVFLKILMGEADNSVRSILLYSRAPRTLACLFAGAALAASGGTLQSVLSNKLASPSIIGVNSGAGLGVTVACALGAVSGWTVSAAAFIGSLITVAVISLFAVKTGASKTTVILGGVAFNAILNALCESVAVLDSDAAAMSVDFRVGGFSSVSYNRLLPAAVFIVISLLILLTLCNELDVVTLGDETARGIGLKVENYRIIFLVLSAVLAGAAVSFSGLLGFIGLIVPHFARRIVGSESGKLIPFCILSGGAFVAMCDTVSRIIFSPFEMPVGVLMAVIGGPVFIALLIRTKGGRRYA